MKLFSSYNRKDEKKNSGKKYEQIRGKSLLGISLAVFVLLFLIEGRIFSGRMGDPEEKTGHSTEKTDFTEVTKEADPEGTLEVHFIDVGHGDATLILCGEHAMMIDCGDAAQGKKLQDYLTDYGIISKDMIAAPSGASVHREAYHVSGYYIKNIELRN